VGSRCSGQDGETYLPVSPIHAKKQSITGGAAVESTVANAQVNDPDQTVVNNSKIASSVNEPTVAGASKANNSIAVSSRNGAVVKDSSVGKSAPKPPPLTVALALNGGGGDNSSDFQSADSSPGPISSSEAALTSSKAPPLAAPTTPASVSEGQGSTVTASTELSEKYL